MKGNTVKRVFRIVWLLRVVLSVLLVTMAFMLPHEGSKPSWAVTLISFGAYMILMRSIHWWVMRGLPKIQGRMMLTENGVLNNKKPPNRFWYWLLRDFVEEQRSKETSDEET